MRDRPLVSVVTPTFNQAGFLEQTLRSVRSQSYPNIEHLVVDGGSTDGTLDILRREGENGSIRWVSEPDSGMYEAVNKGVASATGDVLAYLNSDDAYLPWAIEAVMEVFAARHGVDVVYGDGIKVDEETGAQRLRLFAPFDRISLANYESLMQPAVFWRRSLVERMGSFDAKLRYVADLDYWLRVAAADATIVHVDEVLAVERIHAGRLSSAQRDAMAAEDREMRARHAGALGGTAGRQLAVTRDIRWQRWLFIRFLAAYALRPLPGPWRRFIRDGDLRVKPRRVLDGSRPQHYKVLWNAVVSGLAAEVLGSQLAEPKRRGRIRPALARVRLLARVLPRLATSRYRLVKSQRRQARSARQQVPQ
jgi:glycosyltransferase involved in cell wall biosynthesis